MATKQTIAELLVEIGVDAKDAEKAAERVKASLKKVGKAGEEADKGVSKSEKALKRFAKAGDLANKAANRIGAALIGVTGAVAAIGKSVLTTGARFESLRVQLKTTTGSAEGAEKAFRFIKDFAKNTPFQVEEITNAFIKLNNFGIEPTTRTMTAFGDFASAMGKTLDQFVEAVTDATTNEFERLKEFGIKTKSEGDRVAFTFRGITTEVGKNAEEIQEFLTGLAEQNFGGAMAEQMTTAGGVISNLMDTWTEFLDQVANLGPLEEFKLLIADLSDAAGGRTGLAKQLAGVLVKAIQAVRRLLKGNLIPTLERVLKVIEFVINNFGLLASAFVAGKLIAGVATLTTAFSGLGLSIAALTGPVGIALAALTTLGILAVTVGNKIRNIPKIPPPPGPDIDEKDIKLAPTLAPIIKQKQKELQAFRRKIAENPALQIPGVRREEARLVKEIERLNEQRREGISERAAASLAESVGATPLAEQVRRRSAFAKVEASIRRFAPATETGAEAEETTRGLAIARETIIGGGGVQEALDAISAAEVATAEAEGFGIVGRRKGGGRRRKKKAEKKRKPVFRQPTTVSEFFAAAARGDVGPLAQRTPAAQDIEPTVAITVNNINNTFDAKFNITGQTDVAGVGKEVETRMRAFVGNLLSSAGKQMPTPAVR